VKVIELPQDHSVESAIAAFAEDAEEFQCVLMVALRHDGTQRIVTSNTHPMQNALMTQFVMAWMNDWFLVTAADPTPEPPKPEA
jgi:hypothetical protein